MPFLQVENLSFRYPNAQADALSGLSFSMEAGEFVLLCGASGCGKSTLLRLLKREISPHGEKSGRILFGGRPQEALDTRESASDIGFVGQNPDGQIVTDKVWHELAFGAESLGLPNDVIRRRVAETASYFGLEAQFRQATDTLSGGQKQLVNLASATVLQPKLLLLDEPTGQLDPIAASEFLSTLRKLNRELGITVLLAEHRLEEAFPLADRVLLLEAGKSVLFGPPREVGDPSKLPEGCVLSAGLPSAVRIFRSLGLSGDCPLTVREGREVLEAHYAPSEPSETPSESTARAGEPAVELREVYFRYEKRSPDVLRGTSLQVETGECFCLLGGNGAGKTTALQVIAGLEKPYRGKVNVLGNPVGSYRGGSLYRNGLSLLPQNPQTVFLQNTVRADFLDLLQALSVPRREREALAASAAERLGVTPLLDRHPFDLSGGEQQKCALAKLLLSKPRLLLLDEPTKGLDAVYKRFLGRFLRELRDGGTTVLLATHDVEFAAEYADRCALLFDGEVLSAGDPHDFFAGNSFYTTAASRIARGLFPNAITCEEVVNACRRAGGKP